MIQQLSLPPHQFYFVQETKETADAVAYAFLSSDSDMVQYPFKFKELKDNEVRVQIKFTGLCQSDCMKVRGLWKQKLTFPMVPGHEPVGIVERIGSNVTKFQIGDKVAASTSRFFCGDCSACSQGTTNACSKRVSFFNPHFGSYCTHFQIEERMLYKLPERFNMNLGAPLMCAGVTVYAPMKKYGKCNMKCAVIGIGGLGHLAVQFGTKLGMEVTAFTTSLDRETEIKNLGASHIRSSTDIENLKQEEGKYDFVINTMFINNEELYKVTIYKNISINQYYQRLTHVNGYFVIVGMPPADVKLKLDFNYIVMNQITISGSIVGNRSEIEEMLQFCTDYNVYPVVETFEFDQFPKAFQILEKGRPHFRCVVDVGNWASKNGLHQ